MLLDTQPKLEDIVVTTLAHHPGCTVENLQKRINAKFGRFSIPALYQELRKLRERAVCVKAGNTYSLRMGWVLDLMALADQMYSRSISETALAPALPSAESRQTWNFRNLRMLGQFWTQLLLVLCEASGDRRCFEWAPHAWFSLSHASEESQFLRAMRLAGNSYYLIIGADTKLSRDYAGVFQEIPGEVSFAESPFADEQRYFSLAGHYLITVEISHNLSNRINELFERQERNSWNEIQRGLELFAEPSRITLTLDNRHRKVRKYQRLFTEFFGVQRH